MLSESTFDEVNVQKKFPTHSKMNRKYLLLNSNLNLFLLP